MIIQKNHLLILFFVDGSHFAMDVLDDCVNSFYLLKEGGILIIDNYGWGSGCKEDQRLQTKNGIDAFVHAFQSHFEILYFDGWQMFLKKYYIN
jgi:hypothetical protein